MTRTEGFLCRTNSGEEQFVLNKKIPFGLRCDVPFLSVHIKNKGKQELDSQNF